MGIAERKARDRKAKRKAILAAAFSVVQQEGIQELTMRRCAEIIEYSPCVIYQHFASKEELQQAMFLQICMELCTVLQESIYAATPEEKLYQLFNKDIEFMLECPYRLELFTAVIGGIPRQDYPEPMRQVAEIFAASLRDLNYPALCTKEQINEALDILRALLSGVLKMGSLSRSESVPRAKKLMQAGIRALLLGWQQG